MSLSLVLISGRRNDCAIRKAKGYGLPFPASKVHRTDLPLVQQATDAARLSTYARDERRT